MNKAQLTSLIPTPLRGAMRKVRACVLRHRAERSLVHLRGRKKLFFLLSPDAHFANIGDQAMAAVIPEWIGKHFDGDIIELAFNEKFDSLAVAERYAEEGDIAFLVSGGNFGDTWPDIQNLREEIFKRMPLVRIIQLPQTIFFSDTKTGHQRLLACKEAINGHQNVTIVGRDNRSAEIAREHFPLARVFCYPDMALLLDPIVQAKISPSLKAKPVKRILAILRSDREGIIGAKEKSTLGAYLSGYEIEFWDTDPIVDVFSKTGRTETILKYLRFIASFDAVVTDRFHGLIFSLLTRRPCVVLATHNHKITSAVSWFPEVPFLALASELSDVPTVLATVAAVQDRSVPDWNEKYFSQMAVDLGGRP